MEQHDIAKRIKDLDLENKALRIIELSLQIKALQSELDPLKNEFASLMAFNNFEDEKTGIVIERCYRKNWQYSPHVDALKKQLKYAEKKEQQQGVATFTETEYLPVRSSK